VARGALGIGHVLDGGGERLLHEDLADPRRPVSRQIERRVSRKHAVLGLVRGNDLRHQRIDGKAVAGEGDRGGRHLGEAHGAEMRERSDPGVGGRRHDGAQHPLRDLAAVPAPEEVARDRLWPRTQAGDGDHAVLGGAVNDDRRHAGEVHVFGLHHAERDAAGDAGVDRVAARLENAEARLGGEVVAGGHHVARPHDGRAMGLHVVLAGPGFVPLARAGVHVPVARMSDRAP
jgi:hypothetical protein